MVSTSFLIYEVPVVLQSYTVSCMETRRLSGIKSANSEGIGNAHEPGGYEAEVGMKEDFYVR